ncbi:carcinine hydrolase/isopenicillin-N N-acyltransferase family protein [Lachnoclostridium edouardi]|uniref:carcinine hydrolase/isopenicillin-N N-acyltransferase family protein n=1 Tax=Lachnoclostridium edouardi TaxID=1926283 RepID=UPI000C7CD11F|nr:carcinine hydrolase/isopenicillin-N N-acyltransferase family protein [Lachnoclostridium edouardi]
MAKKMYVIGMVSFLSAVSTFSSLACTLVGANGGATVTGNAYIASTSDNPYLPGPRKPVYVTIPKDGGYKFVHTPCLIKNEDGTFEDVGSDRGMNETGFSWTRSWVVPDEPEDPNKMAAVDWFVKMGSTISNVDEAIEFVKNNPKGIGCQGNYIFADGEGNMAVVEVGFQTVTVVGKWDKNHSGLAARANRWESEAMKPLDISATENSVYYNTSEYRYTRAAQLVNINSGNITIDTMKDIIGDTNKEADLSMPHLNSINNHGVTDGTISAEVCDPANRTFWYTYGWLDSKFNPGDPAVYGANKNSWEGQWIPFIIPALKEEGFYTDWDGNLTEMGERYMASL